MAKIKTIVLSDSDRAALETGFRRGKTAGFRKRCQIILLKSQNRLSKQVAREVGCCEIVVNNWVTRYEAAGMNGLMTRQGQGRHSILHQETDGDAIRRVVQEHRTRVSHAKAELEGELGKVFSVWTLKRYLKKTIASTNALGA